MATNYRVMRCDRASGGRSHALLAYTPDHFLRNWWGGARFDDSFPVLPKPIEVGLKKSGVLPDLMLDAIPLMTPRLRLALESFGVTNIDYFEAVVLKGQRQRIEYFAFNIIGLLEMRQTSFARLPIFRHARTPSTVVVTKELSLHLWHAGFESLTFSESEAERLS